MQLNAGFIKLHLCLSQLFPVVVNFLLTVHQLLIGISKLLFKFHLGIRQLLKAVLILLHAVAVLLLCLPFHGRKPLLGQKLRLRLQHLYRIAQNIVIFIGINLMRPGQSQMDLRIVIHIHGFPGDKNDIIQRAGAHGGGAPVHIHIQRRCHIAYHGEFPIADAFQSIRVVAFGNPDGGAQHGVLDLKAVKDAFIGLLRHTPTPQRQQVDPLRDGIEAVHLAFVLTGHDVILIHDALGIHNSFQLFCAIQLLLSPAIGVHQPDVKHILFVHKVLTCGNHIRFGHQQTRKQSSAQRNNGHNCHIPSKGVQYGLAQIFAHGISFHYHSISDIS